MNISGIKSASAGGFSHYGANKPGGSVFSDNERVSHLYFIKR